MTTDHRPAWEEHPAQDLRPYVLTGGRTRPEHQLGLDSVVKTRHDGKLTRAPGPEEKQVLALCAIEPRSVAELAGRLSQPVQAVKVLLSDLISGGVLALPTNYANAADPQLLEAVLVGLRNKFAA